MCSQCNFEGVKHCLAVIRTMWLYKLHCFKVVVIKNTTVTLKVNQYSVLVSNESECVMCECHRMLFLILPRLRSVDLLEDLGLFTAPAQPRGTSEIGWCWLVWWSRRVCVQGSDWPRGLETKSKCLNTSVKQRANRLEESSCLFPHVIHQGCSCYSNHRLFS